MNMWTTVRNLIVNNRFYSGCCSVLLLAVAPPVLGNSAFILDPYKPDSPIGQASEYARIMLPNDNEVQFTPLYDAKGSMHGVATIELVRGGNASALGSERLAGRDVRELYHALAPVDAAVPAFFLLSGDNSVFIEPQGWARTLFDKLTDSETDNHDHTPAEPEDHGCHPSAQLYADMVAEVEQFNYGFSYLTAWSTPGPFDWQIFSAVADGISLSLWDLYGQANDVEKFYSTVNVCRLVTVDLDPTLENHLALYPQGVEYLYRIGAGGFTGTGMHLVAPGDKVGFYWSRSANDSMPYGIDIDPDEAPDFQLHIANGYALHPRDRYHIGATWSSPFDSLGVLK